MHDQVCEREREREHRSNHVDVGFVNDFSKVVNSLEGAFDALFRLCSTF
jgi:hypothetical protein